MVDVSMCIIDVAEMQCLCRNFDHKRYVKHLNRVMGQHMRTCTTTYMHSDMQDSLLEISHTPEYARHKAESTTAVLGRIFLSANVTVSLKDTAPTSTDG